MKVDPSKVPNTLFAQGSHSRHCIRVFFPGLVNAERKSSILSEQESRVFYEKGILPSVKSVAHTICHDWPPSYDTEKFRASKARGGYTETTRCISGQDIEQLSHALRQNMNQVAWGRGIVFGTEICGIKNSTEHLPDAENAEMELNELFESLSFLGRDIDGDWYVDVAIELLLQNTAIVWRADCYAPIMKEVLGFTGQQVARVTGNKRLFELDINQHLTQVAGFRATCQEAIGPYQAVYIQAYTSDKSLTYHPEGYMPSILLQGVLWKVDPQGPTTLTSYLSCMKKLGNQMM